MFTGLIEEVGQVVKIEPLGNGRRLRILAKTVLEDIKVDDSIAVNGVCLTATKIEQDGFWADAVGDTLKKTTIGSLNIGQKVNLERAMRLSDRLGGHIVQGHIHGIGRVTRLDRISENYFLEINVPQDLQKYLVQEGSIAVDGISFTIARLAENNAGISVIPHTWSKTNLAGRRIGDQLNIECDFFAKYIEKLLISFQNSSKGSLTFERLRELGF